MKTDALETAHFDYLIIGSGLAGFQLALALAEDAFFKHKKIGLIDKSAKAENDKTWCFWEKGAGKWDHLISKSWEKANFYSADNHLQLSLPPYTYKMIRSLDFYTDAKQKLKAKDNFYFIEDEILSVREDSKPIAKGKRRHYTAEHVFDSRIPKAYFQADDHYTRIFQHFKGWIVETEEDFFSEDEFTIMDYRLTYKDSTSFGYVLPYSSKKALIEFTFFTPDLVSKKVYDTLLEKYIDGILKLENFKITEVEKGVVPMTDFPFQDYNTAGITKIGTAGGWVKGSTGYSFHHTEKNIEKLLDNLKSASPPSQDLLSSKALFYDKIFLKVLCDHNELGPWIFERFYGQNTIQEGFKYLDEETNFPEDMKIMFSLYSKAFINAFFKVIFRRKK